MLENGYRAPAARDGGRGLEAGVLIQFHDGGELMMVKYT
jgi:hypothetical protein